MMGLLRRGFAGGAGDKRSRLVDNVYVVLADRVIGRDDCRDRAADIGDPWRGLDHRGGNGGADVTLKNAAKGAQPGAGELPGGRPAVVSGGGGAGYIGEGFRPDQERAAPRRGEGAAGGLEESQRADCEDGEPGANGAHSVANIGLLHNSIMTTWHRAPVSTFFSLDFLEPVALRARTQVSIVFQLNFQEGELPQFFRTAQRLGKAGVSDVEDPCRTAACKKSIYENHSPHLLFRLSARQSTP